MSGFKWYQATFCVQADNPADDVYEVHRFPLEINPKRSSYPAMVSINWFHDRGLDWFQGRRGQPKHITVVFDPLRRVLHVEALRKQRAESPLDYVHHSADDPHFFHESLWAFYASIGYDYKKKKWGERPPCGPVLTPEQLHARCLEVDADYANYPEIPVRS